MNYTNANVRPTVFFILLLSLIACFGFTTFVWINEEESQKRALVVIDVQEVYFNEGLKVSYPEGSLDNIVKAIDAAKENGIPVVCVQHTSRNPKSSFRQGNPLWELRPEIAGKTFAHHVHKNYAGSFTGTDLEEWLRENDIDTLVISGYMTQMCCDTTARQAAHRDFKVEFLSDATGTLKIENQAGSVSAETLHNTVLVTQASGFSTVLTTAEWIDVISGK